jgi:hypothetical protein
VVLCRFYINLYDNPASSKGTVQFQSNPTRLKTNNENSFI